MIIRPVDDNGDILPVLHSASLFRGVRAEARVIRDRLDLLVGDWWENRSWGNNILTMLKESRLTAADQQVLSSYLSSYIRQSPGVREIYDVTFSLNGREFTFACSVATESGTARIHYSL